MTTIREAFTDDEWKTVVAAPPMVGIAVASASPNGPFGIVKEMMSVGLAMADMVNKASPNALINALIEDVKNRQTRPEKPEGIKNPEQAREHAIAHLGRVATIVAAKAPADAPGFKQWLSEIGARVAEASNEGGFFGFGGTRVSTEEKEMLARIASTLGVEGGAPGATVRQA